MLTQGYGLMACLQECALVVKQHVSVLSELETGGSNCVTANVQSD